MSEKPDKSYISLSVFYQKSKPPKSSLKGDYQVQWFYETNIKRWSGRYDSGTRHGDAAATDNSSTRVTPASAAGCCTIRVVHAVRFYQDLKKPYVRCGRLGGSAIETMPFDCLPTIYG